MTKEDISSIFDWGDWLEELQDHVIAHTSAKRDEVTATTTDHTHYWEEKYTQIDGVSCFIGLECECGGLLPPYSLADLANRQPNDHILCGDIILYGGIRV
jgi:hypothetical protein